MLFEGFVICLRPRHNTVLAANKLYKVKPSLHMNS